MNKNIMFIDNIKGKYTNIDEDILSGKKKNIVFLDIDGVIQPYNNSYRFNHSMKDTIEYLVNRYNDNIYKTMDIYDVCAAYYDWDEVALGYLKKALYHTNSQIVIHSGWKESNTLEQLKALFRFYGFDDYIIDSCSKGDKIRVINEYLEEHKDEINNYIIIDDADMTEYFGEHFIKTCNVMDSKTYFYILSIFNNTYDFKLSEGSIRVNKNGNDIFVIQYKIEPIEGEKIAFCNTYEVTNYGTSTDYLIARNMMIKMINENEVIGIGMMRYGNNPLEEYVIKDGYNIQTGETEYFHYQGIKKNNFKYVNYFNHNKGTIIYTAKNIKW